MESLIVSLVLEDEIYAGALMDGLMRTHPFFIMSYVEDFQELKPSDIVICDKSAVARPIDYDGFIVYLTGNSECQLPEIFKFENISLIGDKILYSYLESTGRSLSSIGIAGPKILSLISPRGGSGATYLSQALARNLKAGGRGRSLMIESSPYGYLGGERLDRPIHNPDERGKTDFSSDKSNRDEVDSPGRSEPDMEHARMIIGDKENKVKPLRDLIYYSLADRKNMLAAVSSFIVPGQDWDYFNYGQGKNPLADLKLEEGLIFLSQLREYYDKNFIIIDIGNLTSDFAMSALKQSSVCILIEDGRLSFKKNKCDLRMMESWKENLSKKGLLRCFNRLSQEEFKRQEFLFDQDDEAYYQIFNKTLGELNAENIFIPYKRVDYGIKNLIKLII